MLALVWREAKFQHVVLRTSTVWFVPNYTQACCWKWHIVNRSQWITSLCTAAFSPLLFCGFISVWICQDLHCTDIAIFQCARLECVVLSLHCVLWPGRWAVPPVSAPTHLCICRLDDTSNMLVKYYLNSTRLVNLRVQWMFPRTIRLLSVYCVHFTVVTCLSQPRQSGVWQHLTHQYSATECREWRIPLCLEQQHSGVIAWPNLTRQNNQIQHGCLGNKVIRGTLSQITVAVPSRAS